MVWPIIVHPNVNIRKKLMANFFALCVSRILQWGSFVRPCEVLCRFFFAAGRYVALVSYPCDQTTLVHESTHQAAWAAKKSGAAKKANSKAVWVGWQELDDPPSGEVDPGLLGPILRDKFGAGLLSISDAKLNHTAKITIAGVKLVDYNKGMKLTQHHIARGRKMSWAESKNQPYTPWAADPSSEYPTRKTHCVGRGQKHRRKHGQTNEVDLTGASDGEGEPEAKHQRRYSSCNADRFPPCRHSPGFRHDTPPVRRRSA